MLFHFSTITAILISVVSTTPLPSQVPLCQSNTNLATSLVHQFPNETWVENLAIRSNGAILATLLSTPQLYQVAPSSGAATLVHTFPNATGLLGITEVAPDNFYVVAGNFSTITFKNTPGSYSVWKVDFTKSYTGSLATVTKVTDIPQGQQLNGMTLLSSSQGLVLIADAVAGNVLKLNVNTGAYSVAISDPSMVPPPGSVLGIDGIKVHGNSLYFTNAGAETFNSIPISLTTGAATGAVKQISADLPCDDFSFDVEGDVYVAQGPADTVSFLTQTGFHKVIAGSNSSTTFAGATSTEFGRTANDNLTLYVSTNGGILKPVNGEIVGGSIRSIQTLGSCRG